MAKSDPVQTALERIAELRRADSPEEVTDELRKFLGNRSNLVVARAAKLAGELKLTALVPELVAAFERFFANAPKLDKRCAAITEIIAALYELDYSEPAPYLAALRHVQKEASFGPPVDEAAKLRGLCAQGLLRTRHPDALSDMVPLLVDPEAPARLGAIRAVAVNGGEAGFLLLKLKALAGDKEPEILAECFAGLLSSSAARSVSFVASFMDHRDEAVASGAMIALGESRLSSAFEALREKWESSPLAPTKKTLMTAMAATRLDEAFGFLVSQIEDANVRTASDAIEILAVYKSYVRVIDLVKEALERRGDNALQRQFAREFSIDT